MKEIIKNTVLLTMITLIAGVLLGGVYEITKEPIAKQAALREAKACESVFDSAKSFDTAFEMPAEGVVEGYENDSIDKVIPALDESGEVLGYVLNVTAKDGYGGNISFMMGISKDGEVTGIEILSISETAGLGMKAKEPAFLEQYEGKTVDSFAYSKTGASAENEIDAISGATITTNAVTNGVNAGIKYFQTVLKEGA